MDFWTEIVSEKNLNKAWAKVKSQNSSPGIDGISVSSFTGVDSFVLELINNGEFVQSEFEDVGEGKLNLTPPVLKSSLSNGRLGKELS